MISLLHQIILSNQSINKEAEAAGYNVMWAMSNLCEVEHNETYKTHFLEILATALEVHKQNLYPRLVLEIMFLVGYCFPK
jgi:hypothetical protein